MNTYCVYRHTFPNGKVYIGLTCQNPLARWQGGYGYKKQTLMFNAIQKYGWENVRHEIVFDGLTLPEAHEKEIELISYHKSNDSAFGYNISSGGESGCGHVVSQEVRKRVGDARRGKPLTAEHREKLSKAKMGKKRGKFSQEVVEHMKRAQAARQRRNVRQYTKDGVYLKQWDSVRCASRALQIADTNIYFACKGKRNSAGGFLWKYADEEVG